MINTYSKFLYGFTIDDSNQHLDFSHVLGVELTATLEVGEYSPDEFVAALKVAFDSASEYNFDVELNRATGKIEILCNAGVTYRVTTGSHLGSSAYPLIGFTSNITTSGTKAIGQAKAGKEYVPQFWLQSFVDPDHSEALTQPTVHKTATGRTKLVSFGAEKMLECDITWATNLPTSTPFKNNPQGVSDLTSFMRYLITKAPVDFVPDENAPEIYRTLSLESTPTHSSGTGFKLIETYDNQLPNYYRTGILKFRVME